MPTVSKPKSKLLLIQNQVDYTASTSLPAFQMQLDTEESPDISRTHARPLTDWALASSTPHLNQTPLVAHPHMARAISAKGQDSSLDATIWQLQCSSFSYIVSIHPASVVAIHCPPDLHQQQTAARVQ